MNNPNRALRRLQKSIARHDATRPWQVFERVREEDHAELFARQRARVGDLASVWKNNIYIVQVYRRETSDGRALQLAIRRNDEEEIHGWDDLQRIKNELAGTSRVAIEVYPAADEVMDQAHMRHLFVLPMGATVPFTIHGRWE